MASLLPAPRAHRIALVDDSRAVRESLRLLLATRGYIVEAFAGSVEFLSNLSLPGFDCFVIDLKLDGFEGTDLLASARALGLHQPAILISGWEVESLERVAARAGFAAHVRKPMMVTSLVDEIARVLKVS